MKKRGGYCTFGSSPRPYELQAEGPGAGTVSDDHGFSPWSATPVAIGSVTIGVIDVAGNRDYFMISVDRGAPYAFYTRGVTDTHGELYDAAWNEITSDYHS